MIRHELAMQIRSILVVALSVPGTALAGAASLNALPADATEIETVGPSAGDPLMLIEGGNVPSEPKATCDNQAAGSFKSTVGLNLQHYSREGREQLRQQLQSYKQMGITYAGTMKPEYDRIGADPESTPAGLIKKGAFTSETVAGAEAAYYSITKACIEDANSTSTQYFYNARWIDDANWADISVTIYAGSVATARKYAAEIIGKVKTLDYAALK